MDISIKLDDRNVQKKLQGLQKGLQSYRTPLESIGSDLIGFYGENVFETQGKALGDSWKGLSAATLKARAERRGYYAQAPKAVGKILIWTGRLQSGFRKAVQSTKLTIDNTVSYFKYHQLEGKAPKRPMLGITSEVITRVVKGLNEYIEKLIR